MALILGVRSCRFTTGRACPPARLLLMRWIEEGEQKADRYRFDAVRRESVQCGIHRPATSEYSFFSDTFQAMAKDVAGGADVKSSVAKATTALDSRLATTN